MVTNDTLSLLDLERHDSRPTQAGREARFCCPLPACVGKSITREHQSLKVNLDSGLWVCYRCGGTGKLTDFWEKRPKPAKPPTPRERALAEARRRGAAQVQDVGRPAPAEDLAKSQASLVHRKRGVSRTFSGTPAADYLASRGIPVDLAEAARVRFHPAWDHWEDQGAGQWVCIGTDRRVVFPLWDPSEKTNVAISARAIDDEYLKPRQQTIGKKSLGVFFTPGAWEAAAVVITEAPIDTLSLAACGVPAIALCGKTGPAWLREKCEGCTVIIGFDNDTEGEKASVKLASVLSLSTCYRLRPKSKDWNDDLLQQGQEALTASLAERLAKVLRTLESADAPIEILEAPSLIGAGSAQPIPLR